LGDDELHVTAAWAAETEEKTKVAAVKKTSQDFLMLNHNL
jgi:hypothetical protein